MIQTDLQPLVGSIGKQKLFDLRFPEPDEDLTQDTAWCEVKQDDGDWQRIRFHDYHDIYRVPGLYEALFYRTLRCCSPVRVVNLLEDVMREAGQDIDKVRALDLGAGNGMVGAALQDVGVAYVIGSDIIPEAREAQVRDRPWAYDDYFVTDFTDLDEPCEKAIRSFRPNTLTSVAALGFGDIPDRAFLQALDLIDTPGWLAFNLKEDFIEDTDTTGFCALIKQLKKRGVIQVQAYRRYCHRLSVTGEPLYYVAMVCTKNEDVPDDLLDR